jgi:flavin reductase (DIM6/NTAB) family NADH-FMN oxidoreductase RutF
MTDFDDFLEPLDPPLVIVTTAHDGERSGCVVGFHSQTSIDPLHYSVRISTANHTYGLAVRAERFAVHVIDEDHRALAELFAGTSGDDLDKFARCGWTPGPDGVPLLDDLPRRFVGRRVSLVDDGGDHVEVTLEPELVEAPDDGTGSAPLRASALAGLEPGHPAGDDH